MIDTAYIRSVLEELEGKGRQKGYVPCDKAGQPLGVSGVTIATGIDLGQTNRRELSGLGVPEALVNRLAPYLGAQRQEALYLLAKEPLTLSRDEVDVLDSLVHAKFIAETAAMFGGAAFAAAPKEAQAVAVSLHFQFGTLARKASPALEKAWNALRAGAYRQAAAYLREPAGWSASHQQYLTRRRKEAALLEKAA